MLSRKRRTKKRETRSYRLYFTILFLVFGIIIAVLTSAVQFNLSRRSLEREIDQRAARELTQKRALLSSYLSSLENYTVSLSGSSLLEEYIRFENTTNYNNLVSFFYGIARSNPQFMQVRFLDKVGKERVRVDWHSGQQTPTVVDQNELQNKGDRYYFKEASQSPVNSFWYSKLDLNIENNKIEVPFKPVLRIASPVYIDQQFRGIVIINARAKNFLNNFRKSSLFNISLIDRDGEFLVHHEDKYSWSRYLQTGYTLKDDQKNIADQLFLLLNTEKISKVEDVYVASLQSLLGNDRAAIMFHPIMKAVMDLHSEERKANYLIIILIFVLCIPVAYFLSKIPANLNRKISDQNRILNEYVDLMDENIITSTGDREGKIVEVSSAFTRICGYTKNELLGRSFSMLRHEDVSAEVYEGMKKVLDLGQIWQGEFQQRGKDGKTYWTWAVIHPKLKDDGEISHYTAIHQDISFRKKLEYLSITDELTSLYNRRYYNQVIERELGRAQRSGETISFGMIDVDFFKQYNDHYGHQKGDMVLKTIGQVLSSILTRGSDYAFRLGGEEFGVLFNQHSLDEGRVFADKIRKAIERVEIKHHKSKISPVITVSIGLLTVNPGPGVTADDIFRCADEALYSAKEEGRNMVVSRVLTATPEL